MREIKQQNKYGQMWKAALLFLAVCVWAALPLLTKNAVEASGGEPAATTLTATLRAPGGAVNPHGAAEYSV